MSEERITNREILGQIHNAQLFSAERLDDDDERLEKIIEWGRALVEEAEEWVKKTIEGSDFHLTPSEIVFLFVSVAFELQDRIMTAENRKCKPREGSSLDFERLSEMLENE